LPGAITPIPPLAPPVGVETGFELAGVTPEACW